MSDKKKSGSVGSENPETCVICASDHFTRRIPPPPGISYSAMNELDVDTTIPFVQDYILGVLKVNEIVKKTIRETNIDPKKFFQICVACNYEVTKAVGPNEESIVEKLRSRMIDDNMNEDSLKSLPSSSTSVPLGGRIIADELITNTEKRLLRRAGNQGREQKNKRDQEERRRQARNRKMGIIENEDDRAAVATLSKEILTAAFHGLTAPTSMSPAQPGTVNKSMAPPRGPTRNRNGKKVQRQGKGKLAKQKRDDDNHQQTIKTEHLSSSSSSEDEDAAKGNRKHARADEKSSARKAKK